jgi:hypothetical protein
MTKQTAIIQRKGKFLKCPHQVCQKIWHYRGAMKVHCICPDCRGVVSIEQDTVSEAEYNAYIEAQ